MRTMEPTNDINPTVQAIRAQAMADLAALPDYAAALGVCERFVRNHIRKGLAATYIGRKPYIVLSTAAAYWSKGAQQHAIPKRGRPRKNAA